MSTDTFKELCDKARKDIDEETWKLILAKFDEKEEDIETVKSAKAQVNVKPTPDVEEFENKAVASEMTAEQVKKCIEDNVIDDEDIN